MTLSSRPNFLNTEEEASRQDAATSSSLASRVLVVLLGREDATCLPGKALRFYALFPCFHCCPREIAEPFFLL